MEREEFAVREDGEGRVRGTQGTSKPGPTNLAFMVHEGPAILLRAVREESRDDFGSRERAGNPSLKLLKEYWLDIHHSVIVFDSFGLIDTMSLMFSMSYRLVMRLPLAFFECIVIVRLKGDLSLGYFIVVGETESSLPDSYDSFIKNYLLSDMECSLTELHSVLKAIEMTIPNPNQFTILVMERERNEFNPFGKGKEKVKGKAVARGETAESEEE
ncbi:hypothetical protein L1987_32833 [Smallanthus sonchifolius]|uniref:Uncharacterized protein n=1 Tax=Smallanthus sonchifolius TaxID=185202 RepID=A0ACB9HQN6_9ASTR|nr:hypothetical protein L1987_32833 [Smallanthus sonchifolius]